MAGTDLIQKYTFDRYCSKTDLSKALGTNLIEPIWRSISDFRKKYALDLPIFDASYAKFYLTYIDPVQAKTALINNHVTSFVGAMGKITKGSLAYTIFTRDMALISLKAIAKSNKIDASEIVLTDIIENREVSNEYIVLVNYFRALNELRSSSFGSIDDSFLAKHYAILRGEEELTSFYRENDNQTTFSKALVDREYDDGVPSRLIDPLMTSLFEYINNLEISLVARISAIFFIFNYVKPFELYNMELAALLAKRVLSSTSIDTSSIYVPLETFLNDNEFFGDVSKEVKRTRDFTYAFLKGADLINNSFNEALSRINEVHSDSLNVEVKMGSDEKKIQEEFGIKVETPFKEVQKSPTKNQIIKQYNRNLASVDLPTLSEKEIKQKVNDLLESDPFLNKYQADFYIRHCVPGKYYTLQQYMKCEKCVYETARTSMAFLAERRYYKQEKIKNKFVYRVINKE